MGIRILSGEIVTKGKDGNVFLSLNPLRVISTVRADVTKLTAIGDSGYFYSEPAVLPSMTNVIINDIVEWNEPSSNRLQHFLVAYELGTVHIFKNIVHNRVRIKWKYVVQGRGKGGLIVGISFIIVGDAYSLLYSRFKPPTFPVNPGLRVKKTKKRKAKISKRVKRKRSR